MPRFAPAYVGGVQLGAYALRRLAPSARQRLLRGCSTNVDNLRGGRWGTLAASAGLVEEPMEPPYALLLLAVLGYAERTRGAGRTAGVFAYGHAGASLLVYAGLRAAPGIDPRTRSAIDVGPSYGFNAVVGALARTLPRGPARTAATGALLALGVRPLLRRERTFTDAGHLAALVLGLTLPISRDRRNKHLREAAPHERVR